MLTHYFSRPPVLHRAKFSAFVVDVRNMMAALPPEIVIKGRDGFGEPEVDSGAVAFNGDAAQRTDHESLIIEQTYTLRPPSRMRDGAFHDFCKAAGKPYDVLVVATLYTLIHRFPQCSFTTDAGEDELRDGFDLFTRVVKTGDDADALFVRPLRKS